MKKFIALFSVIAVVISLLNCCAVDTKTEITSQTTDVVITDEKTVTELNTQEYQTEYSDENVITLYKSAGVIKLPKTDYEKRYSEEVLNEISELVPIEFGCDEYNNWDDNPNVVLNDIYHGMGRWAVDTYDYESAEHKLAVEELNNSPYGNPNHEGFFTSVEKINSFLRDVYGPSARTFKAENFETYDEIRMREESVFSDYDYSFRFAYLPKSEIVCCFARETWGGELPTMDIRDIRMLNGEYIVEYISDSYYPCYIKYLITVSAEENGNLYVKNVEDFYVFPNDNVNNLKVISENAEVELKKYKSGDWITVDTLSAGDEVYSQSDIDFVDDYVWIVTEEYIGRVEKQCLAEIE